MAQVLLDLLDRIPIMYLASVRRSGAPRLHPVVPIIAEGRMFVAIAGQGTQPPRAPSPKRFDLARDGRYAMHALPGKRDDEFYITGRAHRTQAPEIRELVVRTANHQIHAEDWIFEFEIEHAMTAYWEHMGQPNTYPVRQLWNASAAC